MPNRGDLRRLSIVHDAKLRFDETPRLTVTDSLRTREIDAERLQCRVFARDEFGQCVSLIETTPQLGATGVEVTFCANSTPDGRTNLEVDVSRSNCVRVHVPVIYNREGHPPPLSEIELARRSTLGVWGDVRISSLCFTDAERDFCEFDLYAEIESGGVEVDEGASRLSWEGIHVVGRISF
jgi:hypothetical protein